MDLLHQIITAVKSADAVSVRELLRGDPALANARDETGDSILLMSIYLDLPEIRGILLSAHPEINVFEAAALGDDERVEGHLSSFPELVHAFSHDGFTALHLAAFYGHTGTAGLLLGRGADVSAVSKNQTFARLVTPLHSAVARGHHETAGLLIANGADPNARQETGMTPLHAAAMRGDAAIASMLLGAGADPSLANGEGRTPSDLARAMGFTELEQALSPDRV